MEMKIAICLVQLSAMAYASWKVILRQRVAAIDHHDITLL
jgi:hypothetical protein